MSSEKRAASPPCAPDAKRRHEDIDEDPRTNLNAAIAELHDGKSTGGSYIEPPRSPNNVYARFENDHEDEDEDENDEEVEEIMRSDPVVEIPKPVRSFKPPGARDPKAAQKDATSMDHKRYMNLEYGLLHSKSKNGIPGYTAVSRLGKEDRPPFVDKAATQTDEMAEQQWSDSLEPNPPSSAVSRTSSAKAQDDQNEEPRAGKETGDDSIDVNEGSSFDLKICDRLGDQLDDIGKLVPMKEAPSENSIIEETLRRIKREQSASDITPDVPDRNADFVKQHNDSSLSTILAPVLQEAPKWAPFSHKPIYLGELGHGVFKSRVVFEADAIPLDQYYIEIVPGSSRMSALQKLKDWRHSLGRKARDSQVRSASRLVILNEHVPSMARNELSLYTDTLKGLGKWLRHFMPDSFIVIKTTIPANAHTAAGRFRAYMEALRQLMHDYPYHFSVELEDMSILTMNDTTNAQFGLREEFAFAKNFVTATEFFRKYGYPLMGTQQPFRSMISKKKQTNFADGSIDPDREAKVIARFLPWIPESFAREYYAKCIASPDLDFGPLEYEDPGANSYALEPQEVIYYIASMDRTLFTTSGHAGAP